VKAERTALPGVARLIGVRHEDDRGQLRKVIVFEDARRYDLDIRVEEVLSTSNSTAGTVRGLHYQVPPFEETKTLWVTRGSLYDVLVDLRPEEATYGQWISIELSEDDDVALYVPEGIAHGYQTLADDTLITYLMGSAFAPAHARTLAWDDPGIGVQWPLPVTKISTKDRNGHAWPPES
jgi:dTDP-4-dehydrorhamnose 3,5-epimerase